MTDVIDFQAAAKRLKSQAKKKHRKRVSCLEGHHKWLISQKKPFENKQGKLVTVKFCSYCGEEKTFLL